MVLLKDRVRDYKLNVIVDGRNEPDDQPSRNAKVPHKDDLDEKHLFQRGL